MFRVAIFAVIFGLLMLTPLGWAFSAIIAAVLGLCVSYIFLAKQRNAVALSIAEGRGRAPKNVDQAEDDALDRDE